MSDIIDNKPDFSFFNSLSFSKYGSSSLYSLVPSTDVSQTSEVYNKIESICNEEGIFNWLFKDIFPDGYLEESAVDFLSWANSGWKDQTHFVFIAIDSNKNIAGAFDIKSNNTKASEIGYWVSEKHSGIASNAVTVLIALARRAGYLSLFAQTKEGNNKSVKVLIRNGFELNNDYLEKSSKCIQAYFLEL